MLLQILDLIPFNSRREKTPFLSAGDDLGDRTTVSERTSDMSGKMTVEDVKIGKDTFRRLIFLSNPRLIQSEVRLLPSTSNVDYRFLACEYHQLMVAGLSLLHPIIPSAPSTSPLRVLVIGLGGGVFPMFVHEHFPWLRVDAVELDPAVAAVAKDFFGFKEDARMTLHVTEGIKFVQDQVRNLPAPAQPDQPSDGVYHAIIVDVDSKDVTVGMSCPPAAFLEDSFLESVKNLLHPDGLAIFNLSCRSKPLLESTLTKLGTAFAQVCAAQAEEDINKVAVCLKKKVDYKKVVGEGVGGMVSRGWSKDVFDLSEMAELIEDIAEEEAAEKGQPEKQKQQKKKGGKKGGGKKKGKK